jgi:competence protein ComEC
MSAPSLLAAIPLLAGVIAGALASPPSPVALIALAIAWTVALVCLLRSYRRLCAAACLFGYLAAGAALGAQHADANAHSSILDWFNTSPVAREPVRLTGVLREDASVTPFGVTATLDAIAIGGPNGKEMRTDGGIRASIAGALAPHAAAAWRQGRTIAVDALLREPVEYRNVGVASDRERLERQGIALFASVKSAALVSVVADGTLIMEAAAALRARVRAATATAVGRWSARSAGVVTAILIGDRTGLDPEDERRLQEAGTYHVIAISGGNIALLTALLVALGRVARLPPRTTSAVSIGVLAFYGYAAGLAPSVLRATLAGIVYLTARVIDHRGSAMNALGVAAACAAVSTPLSVLDPGFVLSFGATLAIIVGAARIALRPGRHREDSRLQALRRSGVFAARTLGAATLCAEIALAPVGARLFGRISLAGLVLNFAAIPLMSVIQVAGLAAAALQPLVPPAAVACGWLAHIGTVALLESATLVDWAPWLVIDVPPPSMWVVTIWYVALGVVICFWSRHTVRSGALICLAVAAAVIVWSPPSTRASAVRPPPDGWSRLAFVDVGQGDATLLLPSGGPSVLVDAGGAPGSTFDLGRRVTVPALWALGMTRLETLVLTHGDPDHIGGAAAVMRALGPHEIWEGIPVPRHQPLRELRDAAIQRGVRWRDVRAGESHQIGAADVRVLNPPVPDWERQRVRNDDSIVLEVRVGDVMFLLPGDIGQAVEKTAAVGLSRDADRMGLTIVKAPHHGSAGSSSSVLIEAMHPAAVIFSAGRRNPFGHPAPAVVERYRAAGATIFRTDEDGEVIVDTDGHRVVIWTWSGRREVLTARRLAAVDD